MKNIKLKLVFTSVMFFIALVMSKNTYAASSKISVSSLNVKVGDTITVTISGNAASWNVSLSSSGPATANGATNFSNATDSGENENVTIGTVKYTATGTGTINFSLSGQLVDSNYASSSATGSASVTVTAPVQNNPTPTPPPQTPTFSSVNQTVYATTDVNVRSSYSTSSSSLGQLKKGESVTRTGVGSNGWSKVTYKGNTAYVNSSYLTTTKPETPTETPTTQPSASPSPDAKSNDSTLKSLVITGVELTPTFDPSITSYTASVGEEITDAQVLAEVNNEKATHTVTGNTNLQIGENTIIVAVTAEDGTVTNYEIKLTRGKQILPIGLVINVLKENGEKVEISLEEATVVSDNAVEYTIKLEEWFKSVEILSDVNAYEGTGIFDLQVGENKYTIKSTNEEGQTIEYIITINNPEKQVAVVVANDTNDVNYKLIAIIAVIVVLAIIGVVFVVLYYRKQNELKYVKPDYSFLNQNDTLSDDKVNNAADYKQEIDNFNDNEDKRKGGRHF